MIPELIVFLPQIESIIAAVNTLTLAVAAVQAATPTGKKALSDIDDTLANIKARAVGLHVQIAGKQSTKTTEPAS